MSPEPEIITGPLPKTVVIRRKKVVHAAHSGGAWKVAYADFVTAMMALFIVLWLMSADKEVREEISSFFNNPSGPGKLTGTAAAGAGHAIEVPKDDMNKLREKTPAGAVDRTQVPQHPGPRGNYGHQRRIAD